MRILIVCDVKDWAIDRLVQACVKYNPQHNFKVIYIPPRDVNEKKALFIDTIRSFKPDLIEFDYFNTAGQLLQDRNISDLTKNIPSILIHHNQREKAIRQYDFEKMGVKKIVHHNKKGIEIHKTIFGDSSNVVHIPLATNLDEFEYSDKEPDELAVGLVGRIVRWKRPLEIIKASKELGYKNLIMGRNDDAEYFEEIKKLGIEQIKWDFWECDSKDRKDAYKNMTVYVGYSDDSRETGTLGLLEAMASGVPVITTRSGIAADIIEDGINGLFVDFDDYSGLKEKIDLLMKDKELRNSLRKEAWNTVRNINEEKMAIQFNKLWHATIFPDEPLVSVIIPATYDRNKEVEEILKALEDSSYKNIEAIICFDELEELDFDTERFNIPISIIYTRKEGYNLAMARNLGIIESSGEVIIFCDSRLKPDQDSILMFQQAVEHAGDITMGGNKKVWFFGDKGSSKRAFVENFSAVRKDYIVSFGMFNERIDRYGGMSQEIRSRWKKQGGEFTFLPEAKAIEIKSSKMSNERRKDIKDMKILLYKLYGDEKI